MDEEKRASLEATGAQVVPAGESRCVWMLAGVLTCWLCDRDLECDGCPLDAALRHSSTGGIKTRTGSASEAGERRELQDAAPATSEGPWVCRDQTGPGLEEHWSELPPLAPGHLYARAHTWVCAEDNGRARIGLDPFAARIVGPLRCVILAPVGTRLRKGHPCAWLDQHGGTLTVLAPISGQVVACNEALGRRTDFALRDPLQSEWLLALQPFRLRAETRDLLEAPAFAPRVGEDLVAWQGALRLKLEAPSLGKTMADGGVAVRNLKELLGSPELHRLAARFLSPRLLPACKKTREVGE